MPDTILIVSNVTAGLVSFRRELIETLTRDHTVYILAADNGRRDVLESLGAIIIPAELERHGTNPVKELRSAAFFKSKMREIKPDIVLTYTIKANIYAGMAAASLGIPYVANITGLGPAVENGGLMQKITVPLYRYGLRKARKVFFQNTANRDFMLARHMVREGQYDLLPGSGVNLAQYQPTPYPDGDSVDFLFISRVMKEKGIDQYLEAAREIRARHPETRFHVCGRCEQDYEPLLHALQEEGLILYHGSVNDVAGMHRVCASTGHPSYYPEGMSNVLLESCACGRPIITTNRPGCGEIVDDGVNGFVVREKDSADLVEKIEKFLNLPWERRRDMGLAGRAKVEKEFDRQIVVKKYLDELAAVQSGEERHAQTV